MRVALAKSTRCAAAERTRRSLSITKPGFTPVPTMATPSSLAAASSFAESSGYFRNGYASSSQVDTTQLPAEMHSISSSVTLGRYEDVVCTMTSTGLERTPAAPGETAMPQGASLAPATSPMSRPAFAGSLSMAPTISSECFCRIRRRIEAPMGPTPNCTTRIFLRTGRPSARHECLNYEFAQRAAMGNRCEIFAREKLIRCIDDLRSGGWKLDGSGRAERCCGSKIRAEPTPDAGGDRSSERRRLEAALLEASARSADIFAQGGDVGAIGPDAAGVDGQTKGLGLFDAQAGIIELGEAVAFDRHEAVALRTIERARRGAEGGGRCLSI